MYSISSSFAIFNDLKTSKSRNFASEIIEEEVFRLNEAKATPGRATEILFSLKAVIKKNICFSSKT
jgi:hypothetical protein